MASSCAIDTLTLSQNRRDYFRLYSPRAQYPVLMDDSRSIKLIETIRGNDAKINEKLMQTYVRFSPTRCVEFNVG